LKKTEPRQLSLVFADSPPGGGSPEPSDASERRSFLLHKARSKKTKGSVASVADVSRLLEEVASEANLATALLNVVRNKGAPGLDGQTVEEAEAKAPSIIARLRRDLLAGSYRPGDVRRVWLPKPGGGQRGLGIPNILDRTVQQAVLQVLEPIFEPTFHPSSHGFRPKRGAHTAIAEATAYLKDGYQTVVDLDLANFFDRVSHQRLLARVAERVKDQHILTLVRLILTASVVMPDGTRVAVKEGTPQGGPLSPMLSNVVLNELDGELARRGLRFVRYADDCNIFVRSERAGQRVMTSIRSFLENRMRLQVNEEKSDVRKPEELHFLGFRFRCAKEGEGYKVSVRLSRKTERRLMTTVREMTPPNWGRSVSSCMENISGYLTGWISYFRLCTPEAVTGLGVFDAHIRRRVRAIIVRQKKRPRFLYRHLKAKGVSSRAANGCAYCGKGAWVKSNRPAMTKAYSPSWFDGRMASLKALWNDLNLPRVSAQLSLEF
jgi:group II intron reverse transcriptase/maturase